MTTTDGQLTNFYWDVLRRSCGLKGLDRWAMTTNEHPGPDRDIALVPRGYVAPEWIALWPRLADGEPGWMVSPEAIAQGFTAIVRTNGPVVELPATDGMDSDALRRLIHISEQERTTVGLTPAIADLIMQVAVFGRVVF